MAPVFFFGYLLSTLISIYLPLHRNLFHYTLRQANSELQLPRARQVPACFTPDPPKEMSQIHSPQTSSTGKLDPPMAKPRRFKRLAKVGLNLWKWSVYLHHLPIDYISPVAVQD